MPSAFAYPTRCAPPSRHRVFCPPRLWCPAEVDSSGQNGRRHGAPSGVGVFMGGRVPNFVACWGTSMENKEEMKKHERKKRKKREQEKKRAQQGGQEREQQNREHSVRAFWRTTNGCGPRRLWMSVGARGGSLAGLGDLMSRRGPRDDDPRGLPSGI